MVFVDFVDFLFDKTMIFFLSLAILIKSGDEKPAIWVGKLLKSDIIRVADEKGAVLLLLSGLSIMGLIFNWGASSMRSCRAKKLYRRLGQARSAVLADSFALLVAFLSAYIFKSITRRVYNLFLFGIGFAFIHTCSAFVGLSFLGSWASFGVLVCNLLVFFITFVTKAEKHISFVLYMLNKLQTAYS